MSSYFTVNVCTPLRNSAEQNKTTLTFHRNILIISANVNIIFGLSLKLCNNVYDDKRLICCVLIVETCR